MEVLEQKIIEGLSDIRQLVTDYEAAREKLKHDKSKLSRLANRSQHERASAEQQAMFLEDCLARAPKQLSNYLNNYSPVEMTKQEARDNLLTVFQQMKYTNSVQIKNRKMNNEIDEMMAKINAQHQLLVKEEATIAELRKHEIDSKQQESEQYERLMKKLNDASDTLQEIRNANKNKKAQLEKIDNSNIELRKKIEKTKEELMQSNEILKNARQETRKLTERRQSTQILSSTLRQNESRLNKIRNENAKLSEEEVRLSDKIGKLSVEYEEKKLKLMRIFSQIEAIEDSLEATITKNRNS
ncbi:enterophilin-2-related protein [Tritrichomonas foetus]|uniref:Enterophilin-2-related protein n=1 Tax=Tritrichomonas foetus TaxID=1144522 RepID=A0A1J4K7V2_9EUKA|nr:enterophilin-2-related protein [Tritrichomonas foetus]|eukprot:OHT07275.1 enterophilin-2-related protein [Tritrichomonas foetus]